MKKRIFMLALVVGVMLSVCGSAWAASDSIKIDSVVSGYTKVQVTDDRISDGNTFTIAVKASIASLEQSNNAYVSDAAYVQWKVTQTAATGSTTVPVSDVAITAETSALSSRTDTTIDYQALTDSTSSATLSATLTGKIQAAGTVTITATLVKNTSGTAVETGSATNQTGTATITFSTTEADLKTTGSDLFADSTSNPDLYDTYDARDPDSVSWDGVDPLFYNTINTKSTDYGTAKPKLGKIEKSSLTFEGGTPNTLTVPIIGPVTEVDVYIAMKDAKKLYPASADAIKANIRLTSASIKQYGIPFRVTSYDFTKTVDATGDTADKLKKAQQKAWKKAENVGLTIAFNGANLQYKGFPLTISLKNKNNSSKPAAKAIKLNIGSNFTTPLWGTYETSTDKTTVKATYTAWLTDEATTGHSIVYKAAGEKVTDSAVTDEAEGVVSGATFEATPTGETEAKLYILSGDEVYLAAVDFYWRAFKYFKTVENKDKPEVSTYVIPTTKKAGTLEKKFIASGDAPYAITLKPDTKKDKEKIGKFMVDPASIDIVQPVYDYLGNVSEHGYVVIHGVPKEKEKESKLAFTLTALNPSTKKKGTAKVTANAKTYPAFDKTNNVTISKAVIEAYNDDESTLTYNPHDYGDVDDEKGTITYKRIGGVKRVEAGKVPSVKVKAKGSKTISYKLGKYTIEDGEPVATDEDGNDFSTFNAAMLANLKALRLSFDEKKGAVVLLDKSDKATKPTLNSDGDAFQSLDIVITAVNNVGYDQAWAYVAITGAKPKMADKDVTVEGTKKLGDTITFKVMAGKEAAEGLTDGSANVKVLPGDGAAAALKKYGLALVTYDSMDVIVSKEITYTANTVLPTSFVYKADNSNIKAGSVSALVDSDEGYDSNVTKYKAGEGGVTILSGDTWAKSADLNLKNYGILQVIDSAALAKVSQDRTANKGVSVNLILENLGSTNKGKIKVVIKDTVNGGDPTKPVVAAPAATKDSSTTPTPGGAAPKTNGTAGLTYNGALPEDADAEAEAEAEGTVTFGTPRTVADLTAGQQAFLAEKGYTVVAVLPEITADVSDQYKLENIELDEDAPEGATLIWIAFPKNAPASEDDEIVDFYDEAGTPVEGVPASHKIIAVPWLREAVTYEPVIAIEAK